MGDAQLRTVDRRAGARLVGCIGFESLADPRDILVPMIRLPLALFLLMAITHLANAAGRPNILVILLDDLGYSDLGCYGGEIDTPNIDRLAERGVRFESFYNSARCCPSRASLMTGLYPPQTGIASFTTREPHPTRGPAYIGRLNDRCVTLGETLGAAGYSSYYVGKWQSVENSHLKELLNRVFTDSEIREQFKDAPGGKLWHHNYLGGLLEHTLSVTDIADRVGQMYPDIKRDLIIAAGLLHDIGKISSYTYKTLIDFTDDGRLVGHIVIGAQMVKDKIREIKDFPKDLEMELTHLILSHQGKLEHASPVVPMTLEGLILYYADEIDSNANAYQRITKREKEPGRKWSSYVSLINRYLYFGGEEE